MSNQNNNNNNTGIHHYQHHQHQQQEEGLLHSNHSSSSSKSTDQRIITLNEHEHYEKVKHLGDGAFSTVSLYRKVNRRSGESKLVALKRLNIESGAAGDPSSRKQLEQAVNEVRILAILSHENIITYYGSFTLGSRAFYIETEYADGGTLADFLASLPAPLEELEILALFVQMVAAVRYLHRRNIIHRDIKTGNVFLNTRGFIKLGDFGISKLLHSQLDARSFVGTPAYICPEIFEGKAYNKPCDIWALGCVLYEMATLTKTFDAKNLSSLMAKIVKATYHPVNSRYSKGFQKLVSSCLQRSPSKRANIEQVLERVQLMIHKLTPLEATTTLMANSAIQENIGAASESLKEYIRKKSVSNTVRCSNLYHLDIHSPNLHLTPILFPHNLLPAHSHQRLQLKQLVKGATHYLALTVDSRVYAWGVGLTGELGLGPSLTEVSRPTLVEALRPYTILKIAAGDHFSVFVTKNGLVLTCGSARSGCLAQSTPSQQQHHHHHHHQSKQPVDLFEPKLVSCLLEKSIFDVSCGRNHVVVVASDGVAFAWGGNEYGKLGIGRESYVVRFQTEPTPVAAPEGVKYKRAFAGADATALLDYLDAVWLAGNNRLNKLALNRAGHLFGGAVCVLFAATPQRARLPGSAKTPVLSVAFGRAHTIFYLGGDSGGKVVTAGGNESGQLGLGHGKAVSSAVWAQTPRHQVVTGTAAGSDFSLALTKSRLFFWGRRSVKRRRRKRRRRRRRRGSSSVTTTDESSCSSSKTENQSTEDEGENVDDEYDEDDDEGDGSSPHVQFIIGRCNQSLMELVTEHGPDCPIVKVAEPRLVVNKLSGLSEVLKDHHYPIHHHQQHRLSIGDEEHRMNSSFSRVILTPQPILELFCARTLQTGELSFSDVFCFNDEDGDGNSGGGGDSIFVVIESVVSTSNSNSSPPPSIQISTKESEAQRRTSKSSTTNNTLTVSNFPTRSETKFVRPELYLAIPSSTYLCFPIAELRLGQ